MKSLRKFAVLQGHRQSRKVILPLNQSAVNYIQSITEESQDELVFDYENVAYMDNVLRAKFRRLAKETYYGASIYMAKPSSRYGNYIYRKLRLLDCDIRITDNMFQFLTENGFGLKFITDNDGANVIFADESMIPQDMTESMVRRGKLVKKDDECEIYGTSSIVSYHFSGWHPEIEKQFLKFMDKSPNAWNFGFEAEKMDSDYAETGNAIKLAHTTGFKKEYDGSLGSDGFELISPILPLFNQQVINDAIAPVNDLLSASTDDKCGGHINLSNNSITSREILKGIKGSVPLLYSLYDKRMNNRYCQAKKFGTYLRNPSKYSALYVKNSSVLEVRLFPAIKNKKVLQNRIDLLRILTTEMFGKTPSRVIVEMATPTSQLHRLLLNQIFDGNFDKLVEKLRMFKRNAENFGCGKVSLAAMKKVNKLTRRDVFTIQSPTPTQTTSQPQDIAPVEITREEILDVVNDMVDESDDASNMNFILESTTISTDNFATPNQQVSITDAVYDAIVNSDLEISIDGNVNSSFDFSRNGTDRSFINNDIGDVILTAIAQTDRFISENHILNDLPIRSARHMSQMLATILPNVSYQGTIGRLESEIQRLHFYSVPNLTGGDDEYTLPLLRKYIRMFAQQMTISLLFPYANNRFESINTFMVNSSYEMQDDHYAEFVRDNGLYSGIYAVRGDGYALRISYDASTYKLKIQIGNRTFTR